MKHDTSAICCIVTHLLTRRCHGDTCVVFGRKYVKNQKCVREQIARMSSKAMFRVAEDVASLKQLLALVSSALQRNAVAIDKLKLESAQVGGRIYEEQWWFLS